MNAPLDRTADSRGQPGSISYFQPQVGHGPDGEWFDCGSGEPGTRRGLSDAATWAWANCSPNGGRWRVVEIVQRTICSGDCDQEPDCGALLGPDLGRGMQP